MNRVFYFSVGLCCLALGILGAVLPVLPTTPFVLLAAFCFSRSSPRLHHWLLNNRLFGPLIIDCQAHGVIPLKAKLLATSMMSVAVGYSVLFANLPSWLIVLLLLLVVIGLAFIWSRPSVAVA